MSVRCGVGPGETASPGMGAPSRRRSILRRVRVSQRVWVSTFAVWLFTGTAGAQPEPRAPLPPQRSPEPNPPQQEPQPEAQEASALEVTVEGQRREPLALGATTIEASVLRAAPHHTASDALVTVPGLWVSQHGGQGKAHQFFFRGFDALHGQDLEIWVAGAPVNEVSHVHGQGYADLHFVPAHAVQRLSVLPGPFSAAQGDFAVAGSVAVELGLREPGFLGEVGLGSFGSRRFVAAYRPPAAEAGTFGLFEVYSTSGFGARRDASRRSGIVQLEELVGEAARVRVTFVSYTGRFASAGVLRKSDLDRGLVERFATYDSGQGGRSRREQLSASYSTQVEAWQLEFAPYFVARDSELRFNYTGFLENPADGDGTRQLNTSDTLGFRSSAARGFALYGVPGELELGVQVRQDRILQAVERLVTGTGDVWATPFLARVEALDLASYGELSLRPFGPLSLRAGLRADHLAQRSKVEGEGDWRASGGRHLGAKASAALKLPHDTQALVSYGQGFRSAQARSLANGEPTPFTKVDSVEAGLRYAEGRRLQASAAFFQTWLTDDLIFDETQGRNRAVPATLRRGAVLHLQTQPAPWFVSSLSIAYTRATFRADGEGYITKGSAVPFVPALVTRSDLALRRGLGELYSGPLEGELGLGITGVHHRPLPYGERGSNTSLLDAQASLRLDPFALRLEITNLLNQAWNDGEFVYASRFSRTEPPSSLPERHLTAGAPRSLFLTLSCAF